METRTVNAPGYTNKNFRLPSELHEWFKAEARRQDRSVNAEMVRALRAYRAAREISHGEIEIKLNTKERNENG